MKIDVFISYSHGDEWLKNELIQHLSALQRSGIVGVWHDRMITPGSDLTPEIMKQVDTSHVFLFLVSPAFLSSDYCVEKEYLRAKARNDRGEAVVIPVIVRECDWDVHGLRNFAALPLDAVAVTKNAAVKEESHQRDSKWLEVITGLKTVIVDLKKKLNPPKLAPEYLDRLFKVDFVRHQSMAEFDESQFFVDPEIYFEKEKRQVNKTDELVKLIVERRAVVINGSDRSGKSLLAKRVQVELQALEQPAVLISGGEISNQDIEVIINKRMVKQFGSASFPKAGLTVIIDDFDECTLRDNVKERIVRKVCEICSRVVIFAFSSAPTVLFSFDDLPDPVSLTISQLGNEKVYEIVRRWKFADDASAMQAGDIDVMAAFERIMILFNQTEAQKYAYNVVTYLELLDATLGSDIAPSSFASCYETLLQGRLIKAGCDYRQLDEFKNFISLVAYCSYQENQDGRISLESFNKCLELFHEQYLSSKEQLTQLSRKLFLIQETDGYSFAEDYFWFFLCARYVGKRLAFDDRPKYMEFVSHCTTNVFQKKYANIVIYIAYFTEDNFVLRQLTDLLDRLFSKATDWVLSDKSRSIILGLGASDGLAISSSADVETNRKELMKENIQDIIENAEGVVAKYTLPFLDPTIDDSELVDDMRRNEINGDSYIKSVNALLRAHSVIGQILNGRSGTYSTDLIMSCITKMVQASGRYASLNHAIATLMIYDKDIAVEAANGVLRVEEMSDEEKYQKVMRIFAFWSVFLSQTGLARYLAQPHSIRALERLTIQYESEKDEEGHYPYNFLSVLMIARLYHTGTIDRKAVEDALDKLGVDSAFFSIYRAIIHIYSYYMPLAIQDKQWLSNKLGIPLRAFEMQSLRALKNKEISKRDLLSITVTKPEVVEEDK